jgi:hypothetical protein
LDFSELLKPKTRATGLQVIPANQAQKKLSSVMHRINIHYLHIRHSKETRGLDVVQCRYFTTNVESYVADERRKAPNPRALALKLFLRNKQLAMTEATQHKKKLDDLHACTEALSLSHSRAVYTNISCDWKVVPIGHRSQILDPSMIHLMM